MDYETWSPVYRAVLADFGYDRAGDERARDVLAGLVDPFEVDRLRALFDDRTVAVAGGAPSLAADGALDLARRAEVVVAASTAADVLADAGIGVDLMVTDLDKNVGTARDLTRRGVPVAAHAHGDNVPAVREWVPRFDPEHTLPTTQAEPRGPVENFGGFTDGDRAAFLADHFGADRLVFPGWDFEDPAAGPEKRHKLVWAERLLRWLERRRDERFSVLNGRRETIDTSDLPI
jgi:uncharacterized Rossmann fold enzyme